MSVNDEFDLDADVDAKMDAIARKAEAEQKQKLPKVKADVILNEKKSMPPAKDKLVRIMIDEVQGMSNYETVSPNGKVYKIKRGVPVEVPQEVVNALELCVMTHIEERRNPVTGEREEIKKTFSAIPWRKM